MSINEIINNNNIIIMKYNIMKWKMKINSNVLMSIWQWPNDNG